MTSEERRFITALASNPRPDSIPAEFIAQAVTIFNEFILNKDNLKNTFLDFLIFQRVLLSYSKWQVAGDPQDNTVRPFIGSLLSPSPLIQV